MVLEKVQTDGLLTTVDAVRPIQCFGDFGCQDLPQAGRIYFCICGFCICRLK
jgi:hypothetical protein